MPFCQNRHAPRERVSWNDYEEYTDKLEEVTLHVSVWVEMSMVSGKLFHVNVTLHVSVWVEIGYSALVFKNEKRHAPRERVSWNLSYYVAQTIEKQSRSTLEYG